MTATEAAFRKLAKSRFLSRFRIVDFLMAWIDSQSNAGAPKASIAEERFCAGSRAAPTAAKSSANQDFSGTMENRMA